MESIMGFYSNLFAIEIEVFGIIAAAVFVFLQIVYSQLSYREVNVIFRNPCLIVYFTLSTITLLMTAFGSLLLSFPNHDFISKIDFRSNDILKNEIFALILLSLFFISLGLFSFLTFSNIRYIRPNRVILLIGKKIKREKIRDFLLRKYGVPEPDDWRFLSIMSTSGDLVDLIGIKSQTSKKFSKEEYEEFKAKKDDRKRKLLEDKKQYEEINKTIQQIQNPLESLDALTFRAVNTFDFVTLDEIQAVLHNISKDFIEFYGRCRDRDIQEWNPDIDIVENFLRYISDILRFYIKMCDRQQLDLGKIKVLGISEKIIADIVPRNKKSEIEIILAFRKEIADSSIGVSPQVFNKIIQFYKDSADYAFEKGIDENKEWLDEIFRHLGWLGERLLDKQGIEQKPIIRDYYYSNEFDELFNALLSYDNKYENDHPNSYPLIYFDAIHVVFIKLVNILKNNKNSEVENSLFTCISVYYSFALKAILHGNRDGAELATRMNLAQCYDRLVKEELEQSARDTIRLLVFVGMTAAGNRDKINNDNESLWSEPLDEYIIKIIEKSRFDEEIADEIRKEFIKVDGNHDLIWGFIKDVGKRKKTNFGFRFDWQTGEIYPSDSNE